MKKLFIAVFITLLIGTTASVVTLYAQDGVAGSLSESPVATPEPDGDEQEGPPELPTELPDEAVGLLTDIQKWLLFVSGLIATHIMAGVKNVPWLGKQQWFLKLVTELVSGVTASVVAFLLGNAAVLLGLLDQSGLWQVALYAWPAAVGIYHAKKLSKFAQRI